MTGLIQKLKQHEGGPRHFPTYSQPSGFVFRLLPQGLKVAAGILGITHRHEKVHEK